MRTLIILITTSFILTGCISPREFLVTSSTTLGAVVGTVVGGPAGGAAGGVITGVITEVLVEDDEETTVEILEEIPEEDRKDVLKFKEMWSVLEKLGKWAIAGVAIFFIIPLIIPSPFQWRRKK